ncbi:SET domain-containing protein-lysine N-methyltransferase [Verminephrobacter sp. Larva24]|nr:SET domain-containing protein-lysine N-methyltransferase [Verminephrobacter sp. Larva24]
MAQLAQLRGNLAPDGVVIKPSACAPRLLQHSGRALVFDDYPALKKASEDPDLDVTGDDILVLRNAGPRGAGMPRHPHDPMQPRHTFYFHVDDEHVIDAKFGGNSSRWINHSCLPNCYADEREGRIFITALRNIKAGEELSYDYGLTVEERYTPRLKAEYPCWCGSPNCRGTLLAVTRH